MKTKKMTGLCALCVVLILTLFACERDWPILGDNNGSSIWNQNGYTLKVANEKGGTFKTGTDTIRGFKGLAQSFCVFSNSTGQAVSGVTFTFGDGSSLTSEQVIHIYTTTGVFTLVINIPGVTTPLSGPVKITEIGGDGTGADLILISSSISGNNWTYRIGLPAEAITNYMAAGTYFLESDLTGWPASTLSATVLSQTTTVSGQIYAIWEFVHVNGWEVFHHGKNFTSGGANWANNSTSRYWSPTATGGNYKAYFKDGVMSPTQPGSTLPGKFGDTDEANWYLRGTIDYGVNSANVTFYINKKYVANPNSPKLNYAIDSGAWQQLALVDNTGYYSVTVPAVTYKSVIKFTIQAAGEGTLINISASSLYSTTLGCGGLQVQPKQ